MQETTREPTPTQAPEQAVYGGLFTVIPADWTLRAERVIIREREIAFDLWFREKGAEEQPFSGIAELQDEGYYESNPRCIAEDKNRKKVNETTIYFLKVRESEGDIVLQGFWHESRYGAWEIRGVLEPVEIEAGTAPSQH